MEKNNLNWKNISFEDYEFDRLQFLASIIDSELNGIRYIHDNKKFLESIDEKLENYLSTKVISSSNMELFNQPIYENSIINQHDRNLKNIEFFQMVNSFSKKFGKIYYKKTKKLYEDLFYIYLPLTRFLYKQSMGERFHDSAIILGIQAHQGCGKTTFCDLISFISKNYYDLNVSPLSIDDIYLTFNELNVVRKEDPRFKFRCPPGTHDLNLGREILQNVKNLKTNYELPRYNKSAHGGLGDRAAVGLYVFRPIDVLLFEGWFQGAEPLEEDLIEKFTKNEETLNFQKLINRKLYDYRPLWNYVNYWMIIKPFKYEYSKKWKHETEINNKQNMNYKTLQQFIKYSWNSVPPYLYFPRIEKSKNPIFILVLDSERNFYI
jgi:D-glycerate 3-kinase